MQKRFITAVIKTSKSIEAEMPWARGARREVFISRRSGYGCDPRTA